jgi:hypothetical protein
MSHVTSLALAPFSALIRQCHAHPWLAIAISFGVALVAELTGHDVWAAILVSFGAYVLMWLGERDRPVDPAAAEVDD